MIRLLTLSILSVIFILPFSGKAYSAAVTCIAGLPCVVPFTPNTPSDPSDGPNVAGAPNEPRIDGQACDADFMNQIHARAYLEANREIMISELLVTKPDSVLEYTCFDQRLRDIATIAGPLFTETNLFQGATVANPGTSPITINVYMGDFKQDISLTRLVLQSLNTYIDSNFAHDFLGGTAGINNSIATSILGAGSSCTFMNDVYQLAKCENINPATFFMSFTEIEANDPRNTLPADLQCGAINPITTDLINVANNTGGTYAYVETTDTYLNFLDTAACEPPIPTGLTVNQRTHSISATTVNIDSDITFEDHVCPNPGCYFDQASGNCTN